MDGATPTSAIVARDTSGWAWSAEPLVALEHDDFGAEERRRERPRGLVMLGLQAAVLSLLVLVVVGAVWVANERPAAAHTNDAAAPATPTVVDFAPIEPAEPAADAPPAAVTVVGPSGPPDGVVWVTEDASSLRELSRAWGIPLATLSSLNPALSTDNPVPAGARVSVYSPTIGPDYSIGAPNAGRLVRGVPMPQSAAWELPPRRARAYGTEETIANVTVALTAYARRFPDADPVEIGELSTRRGGKISSHHSHQTGRDVDIRLVLDDGEPAAARNWFLIRTFIDGGGVQAIYLNASEHGWLRHAAEADVGAERTAEYFDLIRHEPGHREHFHVRFACPGEHRRCVNYPRRRG